MQGVTQSAWGGSLTVGVPTNDSVPFKMKLVSQEQTCQWMWVSQSACTWSLKVIGVSHSDL